MSEAIEKLAVECFTMVQLYPDKAFSIIRKYTQMSILVGLEHFDSRMEEIVVLDKNGIELERFKSARDASEKLGISKGNILNCIAGTRHSAGGLRFIKKTDYQLLRRSTEKPKP